MRKVMILFGKSNWQKAKPFSNSDYQYSYEFFYSLCKKNGVQMYRASYQWYDYEKNIFKHAWIFEESGGKWKKVNNIKPDLIYDKTKAKPESYYRKELIVRHYPFINDLNFTRIIDDKFIISIIFPDWCKKNWIAKDKEEFSKILPKIKSKRIVLKPICESGGNNISILNKKSALKKVVIKNDMLVQEFINSSRGVPGISVGMHDLRLVFVNDKIIYSYIREPKKGSYLANLARGGKLTIVPENKVPESLQPIISYTNAVFSTFNPRIFSIDFMFDESGRPWIVELNSMPGLYFSEHEKPYMIKMYKELLKTFKKKLEL